MKLALTLILVAATVARAGEVPKLEVDVGQPGHAVSPLLWGIFFEDINLSADGGIYPELVRNRSFEDSGKPEHWTALGKTELAVDSAQPVGAKNPHSLRVTGDGVVNDGFWGMALTTGESYRLSLLARGAGVLTARLERGDGKTVYAREEIGVLTSDWKPYRLSLTSNGTDPKARLVISAEQPGTFWVDMVSLMPAKTWKGHGLRPDLCEMLAAMKPAFMRFPGGCWVEGDTMAKAYRWKKTIGDVSEREPLWNIWGYWATHGLGFHEYLVLSEDLGAEPLFCINVGMSHKEVVPMDKMDEYVQDALDAIEYANGPVSSKWGAVRAKAGHPAPFNMKYMEIGNENSGQAYQDRYPLFHDAIKKRYPDMHLILDYVPSKTRPSEIVDEHYYNDPDFFIREAGKYDRYDRTGPKIFVGEYAVTKGCGLGNLRGAIGEAAFMTGLERNSDIVTMAAYAPLFVNVNHRKWNPDLINFDSARVYGLPSYYVQKLFAENRGDVVLPVTFTAPIAVAGGAIGVGTWQTQAEFKDIKVTQADKVLFESEFSNGTSGWRTHGGNWQVKEGALQQTGAGENIRAFIGDKDWNNYTLALKARKLGGAEGFLISFRVGNEDAKAWWNIGGWGNSRHAIEMEGVAASSVPGKIETGQWYDIRVELNGASIKCFLDDKLIHTAVVAGRTSLYTSATRTGNDIILKVVNVGNLPQETQIELNGVRSLAPTATVAVLTSIAETDENSLEQPAKVSPTQQSIPLTGTSFRQAFPPNSLTVIRLKAESNR